MHVKPVIVVLDDDVDDNAKPPHPIPPATLVSRQSPSPRVQRHMFSLHAKLPNHKRETVMRHHALLRTWNPKDAREHAIFSLSLSVRSLAQNPSPRSVARSVGWWSMRASLIRSAPWATNLYCRLCLSLISHIQFPCSI